MKEIDNYALFYIAPNEDALSDTLMIYFGENKQVTKRSNDDYIFTLFHEDEVIAYAIREFSRFAKIKTSGMLFSINEQLLEIINNELYSNMCEIKLLNKKESGFVVAKVLKRESIDKFYLYDVDIGEEVINVESSFKIDVNAFVVVAKANTYLLPARQIKYYHHNGKCIKGRICTYGDLQEKEIIPDIPLAFKDLKVKPGTDYFHTEVKL